MKLAGRLYYVRRAVLPGFFYREEAGTGWLDVLFPPAAMGAIVASSVWSWRA